MAKLARLARMPRLSKLINVNRFKNILKAFEKKETDDSTLLGQYMTLFYYNVFRLLLIAYIITYFLGCFWYYLSLNQRNWFDDPSWIEVTWYEEFSLGDMDLKYQLVTSLYFALTTLSTVGYGDLYAVS